MKIQFHRIDTNVVVGLLVREFCCSGTDVSAKVLAMYADTRTPSMEPQWLAAGLSQTLAKATGQQETKKYFSNALIWDAIVSVIFIAAELFFPGQAMRVMGADAAIEAIGIPYIRIVLCFTPFFMMNYAFTAFVRNDNAPHIAMAATLLSSLFNIVFDYVFMFPLGMGMTGAALATAVSPIVSILICMVHYLSPKSSVSFHFIVPSVKMLISSCSLGVVAFVGEIASAVTTMVFNFVLLGLDGNTAVAAYGVIANTALVGTAIFNGVSQGLQPLASEAHARGEEHEKHQILVKSIVTGIFDCSNQQRNHSNHYFRASASDISWNHRCMAGISSCRGCHIASCYSHDKKDI